MAGLATRTRSTVISNRARLSRKHSLRSRRARLRTTELPTFLLTTRPSLETGDVWFSFQLERTLLLETRLPWLFKRVKSRPFLMWQAWGKRKEGDDGAVIRTQTIGLCRGQALAALTATTGDDGATALLAHAGKKPMLTLAAQVGWLECTFHICSFR